VEKREQVFVSSTYIDLHEERQAVIATLLEADCIPAGMELFPASNDERWDLIKRVIDSCDYYMVIVGGRYGSTDATGLSFTEKEFDYAETIGLPIMGFLHGDPGSIPAKKTESNDDARRQLTAFREKVQQRMCKYWTNADGLGAQVAKSLIQIRKTYPADGWIRASDAVSPETRAEMAELRSRVAELEKELGEARLPLNSSHTAELSHGSDLVEFGFTLEFQDIKYRRYKSEGHATTTWDDILIGVGPALLDECSQREFSLALRRHGINVVGDLSDKPWLEGPTFKDKKLADFKLADFKLADPYDDDVLVQLLALGLVEHGQRKRPVSDHNRYWRLSKLGEDRFIQLRARRKLPDSSRQFEIAAQSFDAPVDSAL
jgi:hypothetical protein